MHVFGFLDEALDQITVLISAEGIQHFGVRTYSRLALDMILVLTVTVVHFRIDSAAELFADLSVARVLGNAIIPLTEVSLLEALAVVAKSTEGRLAK